MHTSQVEKVGFNTWPGGSLDLPCLRDRGAATELAHVKWRSAKPALLIPARDARGLIIALHVNPRDDPTAKYKWASCGGSFKHPTFGDPLFCCAHAWSVEERRIGRSTGRPVALIDGGHKAYVFAHLAARGNVIGAAGGQFGQAERGLLRCLQHFNASRAILFPDAGAIKNKAVLRDYFRTFRLLQEWHVPVRMPWWGQFDTKLR